MLMRNKFDPMLRGNYFVQFEHLQGFFADLFSGKMFGTDTKIAL